MCCSGVKSDNLNIIKLCLWRLLKNFSCAFFSLVFLFSLSLVTAPWCQMVDNWNKWMGTAAKGTAVQRQLQNYAGKCMRVCVCIRERQCIQKTYRHTTTFSVQLDCTRQPLPLTLAWDKLHKQEVRRPGTSCLPWNGPLVPRGSVEKPWAAATTATTTFLATFTAHRQLPGRPVVFILNSV